MKNTVIRIVNEFVSAFQDSPDVTTRWGVPIVGFASAADPLFDRLSSVASPTHAVPRDFLPQAKTIIACFFPFKNDLVRTNIKGRHASEHWGRAYVETNEMIRQLSLHLKDFFTGRGHASVTIPATHNWDEAKLISDWSHRHVAYIAGLGNFGLNNMLITEKGCCGRLSTFITSAGLELDERTEAPACLFKFDGTCKKCTGKCVNQALFEDEFNRFKCYDMCLENADALKSVGYADVCGKCLAGVPCSHMNPVKRKQRAT